MPSPLRVYARLTEAEKADGRRLDLQRAVESGLVSFLTRSAGLVGADTAPTMPRPGPLRGRQGTLVTPAGLAVVIACLDGLAGDDTDGLPVRVQVVCQGELWLYRHSRCLVGVFDGRRWRSGWLAADEIQQKALTDAAEEMTRRVAARDPPLPDGDDLAAVRRVFAVADEGVCRLGREHVAGVDRLLLLRRRAAALTKRAKVAEARLRYAVGGHRAAQLPDGRTVRLDVNVDKLGRASRRLRVGRR